MINEGLDRHDGYYEGIRAEKEQENVYRVDPQTGEIKVVDDDFVQPNGITFSRDEKRLYVIDTGISEGPENSSPIRVFDVDTAEFRSPSRRENTRLHAELPSFGEFAPE